MRLQTICSVSPRIAHRVLEHRKPSAEHDRLIIRGPGNGLYRLLGSAPVPDLATQGRQLQQSGSGQRSTGGNGVVLDAPGPHDQLFMVIAGVEESAVRSGEAFQDNLGQPDGYPVPALVERSLVESKHPFENGCLVLQIAVRRRLLYQTREQRIRPRRDDKVLAGWNGLMLTSFAEAARHLGAASYLRAAEANAAFLVENMQGEDGRMIRSWREGKAAANGYLEDQAAVLEGMLALYQTTFNERWYRVAVRLAEVILERFAAPDGYPVPALVERSLV